jgi:hypothetical protein
METPILDIIVVKPDEPKNDNLLLGYAINIIRSKIKMREELNTNVIFNN